MEAGEQCDCGSFKQYYNKKCCQQYCKFQGDAVYNTGLCCINCMYSEIGTLCKEIQNICDLPEYCIGTVPICGDDLICRMKRPVLKRVSAIMGPALTLMSTAEKFLEVMLFRVMMSAIQ